MPQHEIMEFDFCGMRISCFAFSLENVIISWLAMYGKNLGFMWMQAFRLDGRNSSPELTGGLASPPLIAFQLEAEGMTFVQKNGHQFFASCNAKRKCR